MAQRLSVNKTYKLFIGGKFPRSESGQTGLIADKSGQPIAAYCHASRKDLRDAVVQASKGFAAWNQATAYLRGQILYRAAEMLEGSADQMMKALQWHKVGKSASRRAVEESIDRLVYFAGWTDKFQQLSSSVNPVASPHFVFTVPEPTGVVVQVHAAGDLPSLVGGMASVLCGANVCISVVGEHLAIAASILGEIWHTSDLPAGAMAILTGDAAALGVAAASHRAVDGLWVQGIAGETERAIQIAAADTVKRLHLQQADTGDSLETILAFQDMKTTWHPVAY